MEDDKISGFRDLSEEEDEDSDRQYKWRHNQEDESSMAGEVSAESDLSEEENLEEEEENDEDENEGKSGTINGQPVDKKISYDMDDVGTDDDLESHRHDNVASIVNKQDNKSVDDLITDISDMSDIEDQMSAAQSKLMEDKQSLRGVMGFVDEVTHKGEILAKKASQTQLPALNGKLSTESNLSDPFSLLDDEEQAMSSFYGHPYGRGPMKVYEENQLVGQVEYLPNDDVVNTFIDTSSLKSTQDNARDCETRKSVSHSESEVDLDSVVSMSSEGDKRSNKKRLSGSSNISDEDVTNGTIEEKLATVAEHDASPDKDVTPLTNSLDKDLQNFVEQQQENDEEETWEDPECSIYRLRDHVCCFGGGGDGGREMEIISKLNKLKDDIVTMREELSSARKECKKESEEVAKLIEEAVARNKAAELDEGKLSSNLPALMSSPLNSQIFGSQFTDDLGSSQNRLVRSHHGNRVLPVVPLPTSALEERLRSTRHTASTTYRETLNELEKMVEKEMASIQDSMTRLEPLNKMAAEWDTLQKLRSMTTYKTDYRMEMVMSEMRIKADAANQN